MWPDDPPVPLGERAAVARPKEKVRTMGSNAHRAGRLRRDGTDQSECTLIAFVMVRLRGWVIRSYLTAIEQGVTIEDQFWEITNLLRADSSRGLSDKASKDFATTFK